MQVTSEADATRDSSCDKCGGRAIDEFAVGIGVAFQPIVDVEAECIVEQEALLRSTVGRKPAWIQSLVNDRNRHAFDQKFRATAIDAAAGLGVSTPIVVPFDPRAVIEISECVQPTLWQADKHNIDLERIVLEVDEAAIAEVSEQFPVIHRHLRTLGLKVSITSFGGGRMPFERLAAMTPHAITLDHTMVQKIDHRPRLRAVVAGIMAICMDLGVIVIAKGIRSAAEVTALQDCGVALFQGNVIAEATEGRVLKEEDLSLSALAA